MSKPRQRRWGVLFAKMSTYFPILLYIIQVAISYKHSTPLECDSLNTPFSILTAKQ